MEPDEKVKQDKLVFIEWVEQWHDVELQERVVFHYSGLLEANQWGGYISQNGKVLLR